MAKPNETLKLHPRINLFNSELARKQQELFAEIFSKHSGNWQAIKTDLAGKEGFTGKVIQKLEFTHNLAAWSNDNTELVSLFQKNQGTNSLRDIALKQNRIHQQDKKRCPRRIRTRKTGVHPEFAPGAVQTGTHGHVGQPG